MIFFLSLFSLTVATLSETLPSQTDSRKPPIDTTKSSIEHQILSYQNNDFTILANSRKMLADKLKNGDKMKAKEVRDYLHGKYDSLRVLPFYIGEELLINYYVGDFAPLFNTNKIDSVFGADLFGYTVPPDDKLLGKLRKQMQKDHSSIEGSIDSSYGKGENRSWLRLFLHYLLYDRFDTLQNYEAINAEADTFLIDHPLSKRTNFIHKYIRFRFVLSPWGGGWEFFSGGGYYQGSLSHRFEDNVAIGVAFDIYYKKAVFYLRDLIGVGSGIKRDFYYKGLWAKGQNLNVFLPEFTVGGTVLESPHWAITPFAGIASSNISLPSAVADTAKYKNELPFKTTWVGGLNTDLRFPKNGNATSNIPNYKTGAFFLRLRLTYFATTFDELDPMFKGGLFYFTIGLGGFGRPVKRHFGNIEVPK